jgi:glycosyltransferase involved in cell wall biosynthesis
MEKLSQPTSTQNNALSVVISTRSTENVSLKHLMERFAHPKTEFLIYENNNQYSLSELYNKGLSESKNDIIIFLHDDIIVETPSITRKIIKLFENNPDYGIIGLAGTDTLVSGMWWEKRDRMFGQVKHQHEGRTWKNTYSNSFGDNLKEVVCVDGLFFAVHKNRIKEKFDEDFKGFHFYDIPFSVSNHLNGVKVGVTTKIMVIHKSIGMVDKKWELNKMFFEAKYGEKLPLTI